MDIKLLIASGAAAIALLAAPVARAGLLFEYSTDMGASFIPLPCNPTGPGSCSVPTSFITGPGFNWQLQNATAVSHSPGPPNPDLLEATVGSLTNNAGTPQTIVFSIGDTNFTTPNPSGLSLMSSVSGSVSADPTLSLISCLDPGNRQNYCAGASVIITEPLQSSVTNGPFGPLSNSVTIRSLSSSPPYSMTIELTFTLTPFSSINATASTNVAAVPEPASIALLGVGLFGMGFLRRRGGRASGIESNQAV